MLTIPIGTSATQTVTVTKDMTIAGVDASKPAVFSTPVMIYLMEVTAASAIEQFLPKGWISVGVQVSVRHLAATGMGDAVRVNAKVTATSENTVTFSVEAYDSSEKIGDGTHVRAAVQVDRFMKRVNAKKGARV